MCRACRREGASRLVGHFGPPAKGVPAEGLLGDRTDERHPGVPTIDAQGGSTIQTRKGRQNATKCLREFH